MAKVLLGTADNSQALQVTSSESNPPTLSFRGSVKAGLFTAQLGVELTATAQRITIRAGGRRFEIDREHFVGCENTSIIGIFKRGVRLRHCQPGLPSNLVFYPRIGQEALRCELVKLGWH